MTNAKGSQQLRYDNRRTAYVIAMCTGNAITVSEVGIAGVKEVCECDSCKRYMHFMLSWMFQHDYLVTYCFEYLICMCFVFAPVQRN